MFFFLCSVWTISGCCFFFQAEDGIRDGRVTGVQTCALPISLFEQCAYKYFARYGLGMSERPVEVEGTGERSGTEIGSAVHSVLEEIDLAAPVVPELEDELIRGF